MKLRSYIIISTILFLVACDQRTSIVYTSDNPENTAKPIESETPRLEGVINGGGGKGVLCTINGQKKLEVLDIYEGRNIYNLTYPILKNDKESFKYFSEKLTRHFSDGTTKTNNNITNEDIDTFGNFSKVKFTKKGQKLKQTNDAFAPYMEENCEEVQIAIYYNESSLLIDKELWDMLDPLNKNALIVHEFLYLKFRTEHDQVTSIDTRKLVGYIFSNEGIDPIFMKKPTFDDSKMFNCIGYIQNDKQSPDYIMLSAYEIATKNFAGTEVVLNRFMNQIPLVRSSFRIYQNISQLFEAPLNSHLYGQVFTENVTKDTYEDFDYKVKLTVLENNDSNEFFKLEFLEFSTNKTVSKYILDCNSDPSLHHRKLENRGTTIDTDTFLEKLNGPKFFAKESSHAKMNFGDNHTFTTTNSYNIDSSSNSCDIKMTAKINKVIMKNDKIKSLSYTDAQYEFVFDVTKIEQIGEKLKNPREQNLCEHTIEVYRGNDLNETHQSDFKLISENEFYFDFSGYNFVSKTKL